MSTPVPFIVKGVHREDAPTMAFPPGTTYSAAKAAYEAAHPDYRFDHAVERVDVDPEETFDEGDDHGEQGDFCASCERFIAFAEGKYDADETFCLDCAAGFGWRK